MHELTSWQTKGSKGYDSSSGKGDYGKGYHPEPTNKPVAEPSKKPTKVPSYILMIQPTNHLTVHPMAHPSVQPTVHPTDGKGKGTYYHD